MNKHERIITHKDKAKKLAKRCGWDEDFNDLPERTRIAFLSQGKIRIGDPKKDKKGFGKSSKKAGYGHFSGWCQTHGPKREIKNRIFIRESDKEIFDYE
jgi:hypothetical protein